MGRASNATLLIEGSDRLVKVEQEATVAESSIFGYNRGMDANEIVGIIPAGGHATRLGPLPCSKELFPIGFQLGIDEEDRDSRDGAKVVAHYLLEKMQRAGARKTYIVLRAGKWDIPAYFGHGAMVGMDLAYLMMDLPYGVPYTLDQATPFVQEAQILFGFPDILFEPADAFEQLLRQQAKSGADVVLGLFPTDVPQKFDMVATGESGRVQRIDIKPAETSLDLTWIIAMWTPLFTRFLHEYLRGIECAYDPESGPHPEFHLGHILQAALRVGMVIDSVTFPNGSCLDIGTPTDLVRAVRRFSV